MTSLHTIHESNLTQTVLKAIDVLECLASTSRPLSAPEVAKMCGMSRPTAYRLLSTLLARGYVTNLENANYRLGTSVLSLSKNFLESLDLPEVAKPYLRQLSETFNETAYLSVLDDTEILYVGKVESTRSVRMHCEIGSRNPLHCSSMGKAILAFLPTEERDALIDRLPMNAHTPNTITEKGALITELDLIRTQGFAIDNIEIEEGVRCVGAPIFNDTGQVFAAVSISGPAFRLSVERLKEIAPSIIAATQAISYELGHMPTNSAKTGNGNHSALHRR